MAPMKPILFIGESGTAKTLTIQNYMEGLDTDSYVKLGMNFSSRTNSADVQTSLEANIDKRTGNTYAPSPGKQLVVFLDDMNMPKVRTKHTNSPAHTLTRTRVNVHEHVCEFSTSAPRLLARSTFMVRRHRSRYYCPL